MKLMMSQTTKNSLRLSYLSSFVVLIPEVRIPIVTEGQSFIAKLSNFCTKLRKEIWSNPPYVNSFCIVLKFSKICLNFVTHYPENLDLPFGNVGLQKFLGSDAEIFKQRGVPTFRKLWHLVLHESINNWMAYKEQPICSSTKCLWKLWIKITIKLMTIHRLVNKIILKYFKININQKKN